MNFSDVLVCKDARFSIGIETKSGKFYLSIPVANSLVDYEEFYEITKEEFDKFNENSDAASDFICKCRNRQQDDRLIIQPGRDRGVAI